MKKSLVIVSILLLTATFCFAQKQDQTPFVLPITKAVAKAVLEQPNSGASTNALPVHITIQDTFYNQTSPLAQSTNWVSRTKTQTCKAWALNENWLITAATCGQQSNPRISSYKVRTHQILLENREFDFAKNDHVMLIWKNTEQVPYAFNAPFTKLLAVNTTSHLFSLQWQNQILLSKGYKTKKTSVNPGYLGQYTCEIANKSRHPTDSLFVVTPQGSEFLAAFSNVFFDYNKDIGVVVRRSALFTSLTERDLQFIKETVNAHRPQDWQSIKTRLFYNDIEKPYFK